MGSVVNEEKIIHQKLLYKEFQLKRFIGKYTDFLYNYEKYSSSECENISKEILSELELLEFQMHKAEMSHYSRQKDHKYHLNLYKKLEDSVSNVHKEIQTLYEELKLRTEQLKNKFEYESLANNINELERIQTMEAYRYKFNIIQVNSKIQAIQKELDELSAKHTEQRGKIELKEKQLYQLIHAINEIQDILATEKQIAMDEEQLND